MFNVKLAGLNISINNKYEYVGIMCSDYITSATGTDFSVAVSTPEIMAEDDGSGYEAGYLESLAIYRKIAERLIDYNGFLMHGVLIDAEGTGIAFLADSGVGKTTHAKLWQQLSERKVAIINGDKPLVRSIDGQLYAYGTPWAGKENLHRNSRIPLSKICFIERAEENKCVKLDKADALEKLMCHIYKPKTAEKLPGLINVLDKVINDVEFYIMRCNTESSAAQVAFEGMMS